jgi:hypothetical protein
MNNIFSDNISTVDSLSGIRRDHGKKSSQP